MTNAAQLDVADLELRRRAAPFPTADVVTVAHVELVPDARPHSVAVSPDDATVYVTQFGAGGVAVVDADTLTVTSTIEGIPNPYGVAMSGPKGLDVARPDAEALYFVDLEHPEQAAAGFAGIGRKPYGIAEGDGGVVYVSLGLEDAVLVTDRFGKGENAEIKGVEFPIGLAVDRAAHRLYVANYFSDTVAVIDLDHRSVVETFTVPRGPYGLALSPDGRWLFVAHFPEDMVSVVDPATGTVDSTFVVSNAPRGLATNHSGTRLYVTSFFGASLAVVDISALTLPEIPTA